MPTRSMCRATTLAIAVLLASTGVAAADIAGNDALPADALPVERYAGGDRYETAAITALEAHADGAPVAIIARGDDFPDGLASAYLAGVRDAPILLTRPDQLPLVTQDAFDQLGTERVTIVGGPNAINPAVEERLTEIFGEGNVDRLDGPTRFDTAAFVTQNGDTVGMFPNLSDEQAPGLRTAIVVSGRNFPDALAAGPLAHAANLPILLTEPDQLPDITRIALDEGVEQVIIAGGRLSVSNTVARQLQQLDGVQVVARVAGDDRTATAAALADLAARHLGWDGGTATVSLGTDFPDALSLAPAASLAHAPILLTRSSSEVGAATFAALQDRCDTLTDVVVSGGQVAINADAERQIELATSCADHEFVLSGGQVADGEGDPEAAGVGWLWTESFCYGVRVQDLSSPASAAHLHWDGSGEDSLVATLETPSPTTGDGLAVGCLTEDDVRGGYEETQELLRQQPSDFHVDVHSSTHPDGAIRGQVAPPPAD